MPIAKRTFRSYDPAFNKDSAGGRDRKRSITFSIPTVTGNLTKDIFRAPSEVLISKISLITDVAIAASTSNFYTFDLQNASKSGASLFTQTNQGFPNTQANGLLANAENTIYADQAPSTSLQSDPHQPTSYFMGPNDVLQLLILKQGAPANLQDVLIQVDYEISGVTTTTSSSTTSSTTTTVSTSTSSSTSSTTTVSSSTTIT